jgi:Sigma-70, region 4
MKPRRLVESAPDAMLVDDTLERHQPDRRCLAVLCVAGGSRARRRRVSGDDGGRVVGVPVPPRAESGAVLAFRIAAHKAVDHYRERGRVPVPVAEPDAGVAPEGEPELRDDDLWAWVRSLPPKQRQAVALRFVVDLTYADIGQAMETSAEAARRNVFEGMRTLRRGLTSSRIDRREPRSWTPR